MVVRSKKIAPGNLGMTLLSNGANEMKRASLLAIVLVLAFILAACGSNHGSDANEYHADEAHSSESSLSGTPLKKGNVDNARKESPVKIRITMEELELTATILDNQTSRDFVSMLPLTLMLKDYAETEKISDLPKRLSTQGAPSGSDPSIGDITYYAPWGNLAIFYKDFDYSSGLVLLGKIDTGIDKLSQLNGKVTFEHMK